MNKGGGASGAVAFPAYMEGVHGDWLGDESDPIDVNIVEAMNAILDSGVPGVKASTRMVCIAGDSINNDEGFTLRKYNGDTFVYKFSVDEGSVTGEDFVVYITSTANAVVVATCVVLFVEDSGQFEASGDGAEAIITQLISGVIGNGENSETVTDAGFSLPNFTGGVTASSVNPYTSISAYDPTSDINVYMDDLATYKAFVEALNPETALASHVGTALTKSGDTEFPPIDISTTVASIVSSAISDAGLAVTSAREATALDVETSIWDARSKASAATASAINSAISAAMAMIESAPVASMIVQFGQRAEVAHLKTLNRFAGGMAEINAVQGSAFLFGMALLEAEHTEKVDEFIAQLSLRIYESVVPTYLATELGFSREQLGLEVAFSTDQLQVFRERALTEIRAQVGLTAQVRRGRDAFFIQAVNDLAGMLSQQVAGKGSVASLSVEANRLKFTALSERDKQDLLYDVEEWLWQVKVFQYGSNVLSGIATGGQVLPERPSQMSTTLGGAFSGAGIGAAMGVTPGQKALGAGIGAIVGGIGGYFEGNY